MRARVDRDTVKAAALRCAAMGEGKKAWLVAGIVTVGLAVLGFAWGTKRRADALAHGPGRLESVVPVPGNKPLLVALETVEFTYEDDADETVWRLTAYDAETGAQLARKPNVPWSSCAAASAGLLWCTNSRSEVGVLTLPSLEVRHAPEAVAQKVGQKLMEATSLEVTADGALVSLLADGRKVQLDAQTLATSPAAKAPPERSPFRDGPFANLQLCNIEEGARQGLCRYEAHGQARADHSAGWLRPNRLNVDAVPGRMFLLVQSSLDEAAATRELVVLDESLSETAHLPLVPASATLERAAVAAPGVLTLSFRSLNVTVGVDVAKGVERYRIQH